MVWESEPGVAASITAAPDVTQGFMGPRADQMFIFARNERGDARFPASASATAAGHRITARRPGAPKVKLERTDNVVVSMVEREGRGGPGGRVITRGGQLGEGRWLLMAKHRSGSLEAAVAAVRTRNLAISSSVLLLLTMAVGLIVVSTRRAQNLARQQMEFVAAVSHELRTPVSVIGAAAGNLADGVVGDPQRVRKYGETIQGEARRLAETVERVLQLAGIAAGQAAAAQTPVSPVDLVHESIGGVPDGDRECRLQRRRVDRREPADRGRRRDRAQVGAAEPDQQCGEVRRSSAGGCAFPRAGIRDRGARTQVVFTVEDRGIGIDADDRKHIFEPFYRGRDAVSQQIQGSGLGLNLVMRIAEAHGGRSA